MASSTELRGSAPVLSAKDVLLEVRSDVKAMRGEVGILMSQHLDERITALERFMWRLIGIASIGAVLGALATMATLSRWLLP